MSGSRVRLYGSTSGYVEVAAPAVSPDAAWTVANTAAGFLYAGTRYYTSSGTFAKADPLGTGDIGLRAVRVRMVGGGGGGGGAAITTAGQVSGGSGGAGAAYAESFILAASLSASETVTRGAGGAVSVGGAGSAGGQSSFGSHVSANGGAGGATIAPQAAPVAIAGALGQVTATGDVTIDGNSSTGVFFITDVIFRGLSGTGGSSHLGGGCVSRDSNAGGSAGLEYGGGGGGAINFASVATAVAGGAGGNGIVIVDCYV